MLKAFDELGLDVWREDPGQILCWKHLNVEWQYCWQNSFAGYCVPMQLWNKSSLLTVIYDVSSLRPYRAWYICAHNKIPLFIHIKNYLEVYAIGVVWLSLSTRISHHFYFHIYIYLYCLLWECTIRTIEKQ